MSRGRPARPCRVEKARIEVKAMVTKVIATKVDNCSILAIRHQRRQRAMFASSGGKTQPVPGAATGSPVSGLSILGAWQPMPNPLSRIQLDWQRFWPPPAPA